MKNALEITIDYADDFVDNDMQDTILEGRRIYATMQARITEYPARLQNAITELEAMAASPAFTEKARILAKIEGVKLALSYFEEMTR